MFFALNLLLQHLDRGWLLEVRTHDGLTEDINQLLRNSNTGLVVNVVLFRVLGSDVYTLIAEKSFVSVIRHAWLNRTQCADVRAA